MNATVTDGTEWADAVDGSAGCAPGTLYANARGLFVSPKNPGEALAESTVKNVGGWAGRLWPFGRKPEAQK